MSLSPPTRDILNLAIRSFTADSEMQMLQQQQSSGRAVRDWGGWMDALPSLSSGIDNDSLSPAIMALTAAITTHKADLRPTKLSYLTTYATALRKLRISLKNIHQGNRFMVLATIICLYTAALMLPIEENTQTRQTHHKGLQDLFLAIGPEGFISVATHKLFAGFRGSIIFEAIYMRRSSFTSHVDWKTKPFKLQGQNIIQRSLTIAADIPPLLEKFDALDKMDAFNQELSAIALTTGFRKIIRGIYESFVLEATAPSYWQVFPDDPDSPYRFTNLSTANIWLNYWLFRAICFIHLHLLQTRYGVSDSADVNQESTLDQAVEHATSIYRSMDFVLQDDMKIQGPASRIFTARVAYDILKFDGARSAEKLAAIQRIIGRFELLGFKIPSLPDDRPFWTLNTGRV
ncbi:hypothetical protein BKA67DRAFT_662327 [Truncatella angustata]|uniref:Uncharacterized protein n=1 Tax=Truncatella angustata TaxID=152316 RepID=A0A9P8RQH1_9PEZI|nr:uncharacterized protein BKA67DRAFT_662327 [Truncatella angustata]KAH6647547.1 hypothetical protein BKA67DRAFT_662327 [Truncatella angustata]